MEFSVKGITFSEKDLSSVKVDELHVNSVSRHHLFTFIKNRPFLLLRAGDFIDAEFVEKYKKRGVASFRCLEVALADDVQTWKLMFSKVKNCRSERERLLLRDDVIRLFGDHYWRQSDKSFLSFVCACFDEFYRLPIDVAEKLQASSHVLYSRSLVTSSIAVFNCFMESIVDHPFLQDMYNAAFMLDYGFVVDGDFNYLLVQACEKERNRPGSGLRYLESNLKNSRERGIFFWHPSKSAEEARKRAASFNFPEVIEHILYHHEKADGTGFPSGYSYSAIAQSETILMFADHMTPFGEHIFMAGDGQKVVKEAFIALNSLEDKELLPINRNLEAWERSMDWVNQELENQTQKKQSEAA